MAGIAGYLGDIQAEHILPSMVRKLAHRGGAREDFYYGDYVSLGIRTNDETGGALFICDKSGLAVFFDGEIYNAEEHKSALINIGLEVETDGPAELILRLYQAHGMNATSKLRGAFVFVLHDPQANLVFAARDHLGLKPFYYTTSSSGSFVFGSEIKAILEHPQISVTPDLIMVDAFLSLGFCPGPQTLFKGVYSLAPGHRLIWNPGLHVSIEKYWDVTAQTRQDAPPANEKDYQERFNTLFEDSVALRAKSLERPIGVVLNGDMASQALAVAMQRTGFGARLHSFSAVYKGDEASGEVARIMSAKLGTKHEEVTINPADMALLPEIIWAMDQPVADPSVVLRYQLCRLAHQNVAGLIAEDGAEDLIAGHPLHQSMLEAYHKPKLFYAFLQPLIRHAPLGMLNKFFSNLTTIGMGRIGETSRRRLLDFFGAMKRGNVPEQYHALSNVFGRAEKNHLYSQALMPFMETYNDTQKGKQGVYSTFLAALQGLQRRQGLAENALAGFEKMSALANIEARLPYADTNLATFLPGVPDHLKISGGSNKLLLRNYLMQKLSGAKTSGLPTAAVQVPPFPFIEFTSSPALRDMLNNCLSDENIKKRGLFNPSAVKKLLHQAKQGDPLACRQVFGLLTLDIWFRIYLDNEKGWISA